MADAEEANAPIFSVGRLWLTGLLLVGCYAAYLAFEWRQGLWILDSSGHPLASDFAWIWVGAHFALAGDAKSVFDYAAFSAAQAPYTGPNHGTYPYFHWVYPPTFFLFIAPFGTLPYVAAFASWISLTLAGYLGAIYAIVPRYLTVLVALIPVDVLETVKLGHAAFLLATLLGLSLAVGERRPFIGGLILGLLTYKPQFCLLFPIVLMAACEWRMLVGAGVSALTMAATASAIFGTATWLLFLRATLNINPRNFMPDARIDAMHQTVFGIMHRLGAPVVIDWAVHLAVATPIAVFAVLVWRRPLPYGLKAAILVVGTLLMTPYMLDYDQVAVAIPVAFIIREGLNSGFLPGEEAAFLVCFLILASTAALPTGPAVLLILAFLILRRVIRVGPGTKSMDLSDRTYRQRIFTSASAR